ncbi:uncharacterized protein EI90DRAFT_3126377 [Cantharellus anzutake]|uniref:uncharacterized protein n=1 Tax=Cantharellus anzutake TaxID=1750568 RepID=UPI00190310AC|nr:uncharacterized protein EI90DRAFT_3126377 [Cantharellus anzutake]KAF8328204.1 hypothetical protein EI90DRAFT_3126377 [Cantharellus anzutake]
MDRFSPSSSSDDEAMTDSYDQIESGLQQQWSSQVTAQTAPGSSNKRRAGGAPAHVTPSVKSKKGEERGRIVGSRPDTKKDEFVDTELVLYLRKATPLTSLDVQPAIEDPFDETLVHLSS